MLNALSEVLKNKIVSAFGAGSLVVSAEATKGHYIDLSHSGLWILSFASWMQIIGCIWISILIIEKIGVISLIKYIFSRFKK